MPILSSGRPQPLPLIDLPSEKLYILAMLYIELAIVIVLILVNGLLALAELAIVSSRRARLKALIDREVIGARRALALASNPGRFLSTVQIGITLVGVLSGAFSGATLGLRLAEWFAQQGLPAGVAEAAGIGLVVTVITYFSLVIGELVPKQIALRNPEAIAVRVAPAMTAIARIASPVVSFLDVSGRAVLRAFGYQAQAEDRVTDEEIRALMVEAETAGVIEPGERAMIAGVMRLGDRPVRAVMTPRREVDMVDLTDDPDDIRRTILQTVHSRLPVQPASPSLRVNKRILQRRATMEIRRLRPRRSTVESRRPSARQFRSLLRADADAGPEVGILK
jgi:putative hemolysin